MTNLTRRSAKYSLIAVVFAALVWTGAAFAPRLIRYVALPAQAAGTTTDAVAHLAGTNAIRLPSEMADKLGIQTCQIESSSLPVRLEMSGTLTLDADYLSHVHCLLYTSPSPRD